ncbi:hypothetical protein ACLQ16_03800 [Streptomyces albidoflavus]|uniref:hypothetical protein n=1 Tax=Streptomyces albidoflavus TaxID=1886 RepID=UPI000A1CAC89|nr:hypothetical protein [Streptomyces albidoflavus]
MRTLALADSSETLFLTDRPTAADFPPLPHGLTLDDAVAVRAHEVKAGDLVVAQFSDGTGVRPTEHVPEPFPADPHTVSTCPCEGCEECEDLDAWTLAEHSRVADVDWRFVCLAPAEDDEACVLVLRNRPVAVIPADVAARAEEAEPPVRTYGVMWSADFEASSPQEAARQAYEQLKSYATDAWPPVLEVTDEHGQMTVVDLNASQEKEEGR